MLESHTHQDIVWLPHVLESHTHQDTVWLPHVLESHTHQDIVWLPHVLESHTHQDIVWLPHVRVHTGGPCGVETGRGGSAQGRVHTGGGHSGNQLAYEVLTYAAYLCDKPNKER